ncbi:MAG: sel1 repeat family protein [Rhizobiaceae bacterium]|nr:MAG: sel1 repeat family protein [Rhizobiaceae bacterium]
MPDRYALLSAIVCAAAIAASAPAHAANNSSPQVQPSLQDRLDSKAPAAAIDPSRFGAAQPDMAYGAYQRGLYLTALHLALPRAQAGDPAAQTLAAEIYARGLGVPRDPDKARELYSKAAAQGVPEAAFRYALILMGDKPPGEAPDEAFRLMQQAADAGHVMAAFDYAQMVSARNPGSEGMTRAFVYYEKAARSGLADAQYAMSQAYANGIGGMPKDDAKARQWLLLAARQNYDTAELDLGTWLVEGRGGPKDVKAGFDWLKVAAEQGNVAAQNRLAKLYLNGIGTKADKTEAAAWYVRARRAGLSDPDMDVFYSGLSPDDQKKAIERANRLK